MSPVTLYYVCDTESCRVLTYYAVSALVCPMCRNPGTLTGIAVFPHG